MSTATKQSQQHIITVVGMARSGTSTITRSLQALGVNLGNNFAPPRKNWNPKGSYEDNDLVYKINRGVIFGLNYSFSCINQIKTICVNNPKLRGLKKLARSILEQRIGKSQYWGFKDPRTSKILPFWQDIFAEMQLQDHYVIAIRNPLASVSSYFRVNGTELEEGLMLWLTHLMSAIECTHDKNRIVVSYDLLLQNPRAQLQRLKQGLQLPDLVSEAEIDEYVNEFLDKKLQHFEYDMEALKNHPITKVVPICVRLYELLVRLSKDEIKFNTPEFTTEWQQIKQAFDDHYSVYCYIDSLILRSKNLKRNLRSIKRSVPWKLLYPLRMVDNVVRKLRHKMRERNKLAKAYDH